MQKHFEFLTQALASYPSVVCGQRSGVPATVTMQEFVDSERSLKERGKRIIFIKQHKGAKSSLAKIVISSSNVERTYQLYKNHFRPLVAKDESSTTLDAQPFLLNEKGRDMEQHITEKFEAFQKLFCEHFPKKITATKIRRSIQTAASKLSQIERQKIDYMLCHSEAVRSRVYDKSALINQNVLEGAELLQSLAQAETTQHVQQSGIVREREETRLVESQTSTENLPLIDTIQEQEVIKIPNIPGITLFKATKCQITSNIIL
jgi:hypothetical protein